MTDDRLEDLEIKIAFQDKAINELNQVLCDQQKEIDRLAALVDILIKQRTERESHGPANEKPPHY